jgi:hypothetical protein
MGGIQKMLRFHSISDDFFKLCSNDSELMNNTNRRPHIIILKLKYKSKKYDFAIPLRSNISKKVPKNQYFSLPPRSSTREKNRHGLHYIKMFPIKRIYLQKFHIDNDNYYLMLQKIIKKDQKIIINDAQLYLDEYSNNMIPKSEFSTDIDYIISKLYP